MPANGSWDLIWCLKVKNLHRVRIMPMMIQLSLPHHTTDLIEHFAGLVKIVAYPDSTGFEEQEEMESTVPVVMLVK